jgi:hypothetical protein
MDISMSIRKTFVDMICNEIDSVETVQNNAYVYTGESMRSECIHLLVVRTTHYSAWQPMSHYMALIHLRRSSFTIIVRTS